MIHRMYVDGGSSTEVLYEIATPFKKSTGRLNLSAATPSSVSWTLTKAITKYIWQSQMRRKQISTPAKECIAIQNMPFGLKNVGATYQRLMDKAFDSQIGRNIEVAMDTLHGWIVMYGWVGAGLILTSPEGTEFTYALRFQFIASNNEAEYEALIAGLRIVAQMGVRNVH
uniref:Reverse transcriptase domain-containing protein n=1 Tax=Tanacetum cinerariifolium TaxID=118510 RepID=A0A6L2KL21_TANCI|nr:reverse transcriptase domain-containing protein [Tanacetum cinerariifolium]